MNIVLWHSFIRFLIYPRQIIYSIQRRVNCVQLEIVASPWSPISIPILAIREPTKLITLLRCLRRVSKGSLDRERRCGSHFLLTHRGMCMGAVSSVYPAASSLAAAHSLSFLPSTSRNRGRRERREIRTSGLIKRYRNDNAVSRRSFGGTMGCIMAGMTRPFLSMATHRRRIVP